MTAREIPPTLSPEALLGKSKIYIARALAAKSQNLMGEYQLWASLALELLGKSALAEIHPCLVADPQSSVSLFAAAGMNTGTDLKTITAKTLFERLSHVSKRFDKKTQDYCQNMSLKRNAELHSGEAPFEGVHPVSWEGRYWHTAEIILEIKQQNIEKWLGANQARTPKELLAQYAHAVAEAAKVRVETAREGFGERSKKDREAAHAQAARLETWQARPSFSNPFPDGIWKTTCPACGSTSFLAGVKYGEDLSEEEADDPTEEMVDIFLVAEQFLCPSCGLHLDSREEIEAANLEVEHTETETRAREYEPDYGND